MWPVGYRRTSLPEPHEKFRSRSAETEMNELLEELRRLDATDVVISCNIPVDRAGNRDYNTPVRTMVDKGVAAYFRLNEKGQVLCCDAWDTFGHNLRSLTKTIEALRGLDRWKASEIIERAFSGLKSLPEKAESLSAWWEVLGVPRNASLDDAERAYKAKARIFHPDRPTGDTHQFNRIKQALEDAEKDRRKK